MATMRLSLLTVLAATIPAQTTHLVGPGGFPDIQAAVTAAANGDIILVQPGVYGAATVPKGLTIRAITPGTVTVIGFAQYFSPPPGEPLHVVGIEFAVITLAANGTITLDRCRFSNRGDGLSPFNARVHLQDCVLQPTPNGTLTPNATLFAQNSFVTAIGTTIAGTDGQAPFNTGGPAVRLEGSTLHASGCTISSGPGNPAADAIIGDGNSTVWLSDSSVSSDPTACPIAAPGAAGQQVRTVLTPSCGALPIGPLLGVSRSGQLAVGVPFTLTFTGQPNEPIGVCANVDLDLQPAPLSAQPVLLAPGYWPVAMLALGNSGAAPVTWAVPNDPGLVDRVLWLQGYAGTASPLQLSPVTGGVIR